MLDTVVQTTFHLAAVTCASWTKLQALLDFYGEEVEIGFDGSTYSSPPLVDRDEESAEWKFFKLTLVKEKRDMVEKGKLSKPQSLQEVKKEMESSGAYAEIFPESSNFSTSCFLYQLEQLLLSITSVKWSLSLKKSSKDLGSQQFTSINYTNSKIKIIE